MQEPQPQAALSSSKNTTLDERTIPPGHSQIDQQHYCHSQGVSQGQQQEHSRPDNQKEEEEELSKESPGAESSIATPPFHNRSSNPSHTVHRQHKKPEPQSHHHYHRRESRASDNFAIVVNMNQIQRLDSRGNQRAMSSRRQPSHRWGRSQNDKAAVPRQGSFRSYDSRGDAVSACSSIASHHDLQRISHASSSGHLSGSPRRHRRNRRRRRIKRTARRAQAWCKSAQNRTLVMRLCFVVSLLTAAAVLGLVTHRILQRQEEKTAVLTYESIAETALEQAQAIVTRKIQGAQSLATTVSYAFPNASQWPFVGTRAYTELAGQIAAMSASAGHGFMALVKPEQVEEFEAHAKALYQEYGYPAKAGNSAFGFGIYGLDKSKGFPDGRFHDYSGNTTWNSKYKVMAPFLQHKNTFTNPSLLLRNLYQFPLRGRIMESIIDCGIEAGEEDRHDREHGLSGHRNIYLNTTVPHPQCGGVTDFTEIFVRPGPSAVFFNAIFPLQDPFTVVGFIGTSLNFAETLTNVVPDYVEGLHCVITNDDEKEAYTYIIDKGEPILLGKGDFHNRKHDKHGQSIVLNNVDTGAKASVTYRLTVYPTDTMFEEFQTHLPLIASIGFVAVIVVCTGIFFVYDSFMKYESNQQQKILQVKRRFVRYISHEIRTPLNVVSMGLSLLQTELKENLENEEDLLREEKKKEEERGSIHIVDLESSAPATAALQASADMDEQQQQKTDLEIPSASSSDEGSNKKAIIRKNNSSGSLRTKARKKLLARQGSTSTESMNQLNRGAENIQNNKYWLQLAEEILENSQNAVSVLNDLLTYDKVESKSLTLDLGRVNIFSSVKKTVKEFSLQARNRGVELKLLYVPDGEQLHDDVILEHSAGEAPRCIDVDDDDLEAPPVATVTRLNEADMLNDNYHEEDFIEDPESLFVIGDERRLFQVIRNLISNALKFTPEHKSVTITVTYLLHGMEDSDPPKQIQDEMEADPARTPKPDQQTDDTKKSEELSDTKEEIHSSDIARMLAHSDRDGSIRVTVTDDGVGMTPDQLKLLFNEGVQFNPNVLQHGGGSGLGLAITKEFVELHGGTIVATSQGLGHGSEFTVELPLYRELPRSYPENLPTTVLGSTTSIVSNEEEEEEEIDETRHVLVVDDVMTNKKMLVRLLERAGHTCEVAENGKEAIEVYTANLKAVEDNARIRESGEEQEELPARPFDTILMDFEMPVMNGPDATKRLREMGCKADIFGVTGNVLTEDVMTFKANGADMVLYKPINLQTIEAAWENMERLRKI